MKSYCQRDQRWSEEKLKGTSLSIGRFGCTVTCIADLSTYFNLNLTPHEINDIISYNPSGLIYWRTCVFTTFKFSRRQYGRVNADIIAAIKDPDRAVILQVANASHWVVATGWQPEANDFKIADPWLGDWSNMARYKHSITGAAYFERA